jgi:hypothetical protein
MSTRTEYTYELMSGWLLDPDTRVLDSRMLELGDEFEYELQFLGVDGGIRATKARVGEGIVTPLDLFKLQYRNNPRNNPGLYGLLDSTTEL